jgi:hypothetical protein
MIYVISEWIPYEGWGEVFQGTKEECRDWYQANKRHYNIQDLTVYIEGPDTEQFLLGETN